MLQLQIDTKIQVLSNWKSFKSYLCHRLLTTCCTGMGWGAMGAGPHCVVDMVLFCQFCPPVSFFSPGWLQCISGLERGKQGNETSTHCQANMQYNAKTMTTCKTMDFPLSAPLRYRNQVTGAWFSTSYKPVAQWASASKWRFLRLHLLFPSDMLLWILDKLLARHGVILHIRV